MPEKPAEFEPDEHMAEVTGTLIAALTNSLVEGKTPWANMPFWEFMAMAEAEPSDIAGLMYGMIAGSILTIANSLEVEPQEVIQEMAKNAMCLTAGINPDPENILQDENGHIRLKHPEGGDTPAD